VRNLPEPTMGMEKCAMELVERGECLRQLEESLVRATEENGEVVVVSGAIASGKTALLNAFAARVEASEALFLTATGSPAEESHPFGVLQQLFDSARLEATDAGRISALLDEAVRSAVTADVSAQPADIRQWVAAELLALAADRTVIIGIDDADYADVASLSCLLYLLRRIRSKRMMAVVDVSGTPEQSQWIFQAELLRWSHTRMIRLPLLSPGAVEQLLADRLGASIGSLLGASCHAATGGNPLLVQGLMDDYQPPVEGLPHLSFGPGFVQAVLSCLYRHESELLRVAHAIAVLGE